MRGARVAESAAPIAARLAGSAQPIAQTFGDGDHAGELHGSACDEAMRLVAGYEDRVAGRKVVGFTSA